jgi:hypothetical protein
MPKSCPSRGARGRGRLQLQAPLSSTRRASGWATDCRIRVAHTFGRAAASLSDSANWAKDRREPSSRRAGRGRSCGCRQCADSRKVQAGGGPSRLGPRVAANPPRPALAARWLRPRACLLVPASSADWTSTPPPALSSDGMTFSKETSRSISGRSAPSQGYSARFRSHTCKWASTAWNSPHRDFGSKCPLNPIVPIRERVVGDRFVEHLSAIARL